MRTAGRLAAGVSVAAALFVSPVCAGASVGAGGGLPAWPAAPDWQQYVEAPASLNLTPVRVVSVSGTVTNPGGIVAGGHGDTTLTRAAGDTGQTGIVLDYGRDVGGIPSFTVAREVPGDLADLARQREPFVGRDPVHPLRRHPPDLPGLLRVE